MFSSRETAASVFPERPATLPGRFGSVVAVRLELADIRPGRKRLLAGTAQDHDAHLRVLLDIDEQAL